MSMLRSRAEQCSSQPRTQGKPVVPTSRGPDPPQAAACGPWPVALTTGWVNNTTHIFQENSNAKMNTQPKLTMIRT